MTLFAVMLGGAAGSALRYGVSVWLNPSVGAGIPWGTLTVNVIGCLLIGWMANWMTGSNEALRLGVLVGLLGGFTTFSSFGLETIRLVQSEQIGAAVIYVLVSNFAGLAAGWLGLQFNQ